MQWDGVSKTVFVLVKDYPSPYDLCVDRAFTQAHSFAKTVYIDYMTKLHNSLRNIIGWVKTVLVLPEAIRTVNTVKVNRFTSGGSNSAIFIFALVVAIQPRCPGEYGLLHTAAG